MWSSSPSLAVVVERSAAIPSSAFQQQNITGSFGTGAGNNDSTKFEDPMKQHTKCTNIDFDEAELSAVYHFYSGWLLVPFTVIAFALTLAYSMAMASAISQHRVSRKFYLLLLNRSIGDLIAIVFTAAAVIYIFLVDKPNATLIQILNLFYMACFYLAMVSYIGIGFMKLYGVARPLQFRKRVTLRRTKQLIALSWILLFVLITASLTPVLLSTVDVLSQWSGCRSETCQTPMYRARNILMAADYATTIGCCAVTIVLIKRARRSAKSINYQRSVSQCQTIRRRFRFPLIKLSLSVLTLAVFHFPYVYNSVYLLFTGRCYYLQHFIPLQKLNGIIRACLLTRMIADALIGFSMDKELRRLFTADGVLPWCGGSSLTRRPTTSTTQTTSVITSTSASSGATQNGAITYGTYLTVGNHGNNQTADQQRRRKASAPPLPSQHELNDSPEGGQKLEEMTDSKKKRAKTVRILT